jgi:hypothetical protein
MLIYCCFTQSKRSAAAEEQAGKAKARAIELQNQVVGNTAYRSS